MRGMMAWLVASLVAVLFACPMAHAQIAGPYGSEKLGTFTGDTTLTVEATDLEFHIDFTAGTGTVTPACRLAPTGPYFQMVVGSFQALLGTAALTYTADAAMKLLADCQSFRFVMSSCAGCAVDVYVRGRGLRVVR